MKHGFFVSVSGIFRLYRMNQTNQINEIDGLNDINGRNDPNGLTLIRFNVFTH